MKKTFILLTLVLCVLLITSCIAHIPNEKTDDTTPPVTEDKTVIDEPKTPPEKIEYAYLVSARDYASIDALSLEERAHEFVSALCLKDTEILEIYIGGKINNLDSVKMDAYVKSIDSEIAKIGISVYESSSTGLPVGEHEYLLDLTQNGICYVQFFGTAEKQKEILNGTKLNISENVLIEDGYDFCRYAIMLGSINTIDIYHTAKHTRPDLESPLTDLETFSKYLYDRFGIDDINNYPDIKNKLYEDRRIENGKEMFFVNCAHGGTASSWIFNGYTVDKDKYSYTFTFHSDFAYISPTQKVSYYFEKRDACDILTFTGISIENLEDEETSIFVF